MQRFLIICVFGLLSACGNSENARLLVNGPGVDLSPGETSSYVGNQSRLLADMASMASIDLCTGEDPPKDCKKESDLGLEEWKNITMAGLFLVDRACERYVQALFWFDRAKDRTVNQVGLLGGTTSAILGLTGVSADTIAITAATFGFTTATIENIGSGLLYEIDPAAVRQLIEKLQFEYLDSLTLDNIDGRVPAFWAIQSYAALCLPPTIETEIVKAVRNADPQSAEQGLVGVPPLVGQDVKELLIGRITDEQDLANREKLRDFVRQSSETRDRYLARLREKFPKANMADGMFVLNHPDFAETRAELVDSLDL